MAKNPQTVETESDVAIEESAPSGKALINTALRNTRQLFTGKVRDDAPVNPIAKSGGKILAAIFKQERDGNIRPDGKPGGIERAFSAQAKSFFGNDGEKAVEHIQKVSEFLADMARNLAVLVKAGTGHTLEGGRVTANDVAMLALGYKPTTGDLTKEYVNLIDMQ